MINFPCSCGKYRFSVPASMAGEPVQCPTCGRLNDVPTADELQNLGADGAIKIGPANIRNENPRERMASVARAFTGRRFDENGVEVDLRPTFDDVLAAGTEDVNSLGPIELDAPKYDPESGELIRPLDIKQENLRVGHAIAPLPDAAARRVVAYAKADLPREVSLPGIALKLCEPLNLFVMGIILLVHAVILPIGTMISTGLFMMAPLLLLGVLFIFSHYANVIDEIGPTDRDELPRPLRDASFVDDLWRPATQVTAAIMFCFVPALILLRSNVPSPVVLIVAIIGTFVFPVLLLTLTTSGSTLNARPDRLLGTVRVIGPAYAMIVALFAISMALYLLGLWRFNFDATLLFIGQQRATYLRAVQPWWFARWSGYPALAAGMFGTHWFCWALGILYRRGHKEFPWILQYHTPTKLDARNRQAVGHLPNLNVNSAQARLRAADAPPPPAAPRTPR